MPQAYRVYGMTQSYFTRKMTGYLDYKGIPYVLRRFAGVNPAARAAGWPGGMPVVQTPGGEFMWDTTAMIHHLETQFPDPAVIPSNPAIAFICYALEDVLDEWFYRPAVGSRWFYEENTRVGGWELARDATHEAPASADQAFAAVKEYVTGTCAPFGVTAENIGNWIDEVLKPWLRIAGAHLAAHPYLLGARPSLADFALFGADAAHFTNDPLCRRWTDAEGPALVKHTHRLAEPEDFETGEWFDTAQVPDTLIAVLADLGRFYLPWVSRAARDGAAEIEFAGGSRATIAATPFLRNARAIVLARYAALRCDALDSILRRAGVLNYYADYADQAGTIPDYTEPPRPRLNRPFGPPGQNQS